MFAWEETYEISSDAKKSRPWSHTPLYPEGEDESSQLVMESK